MLRAKLEKVQELQVEGTDDKRQFMEGAVWMGRRIISEVERTCSSFENLQKEYLERFNKLVDAF